MPITNTFTINPTKLEPFINPERARMLAKKFKPSVDIAIGTLLGEYTADPGVYGAYDHTAVNGLQILKGITVYHVVTDANGIITSLGGIIAINNLTAPIYISGYFSCADVANPTELDDAIAAGYAKLISGTVSSGIFEIL